MPAPYTDVPAFLAALTRAATAAAPEPPPARHLMLTLREQAGDPARLVTLHVHATAFIGAPAGALDAVAGTYVDDPEDSFLADVHRMHAGRVMDRAQDWLIRLITRAEALGLTVRAEPAEAPAFYRLFARDA